MFHISVINRKSFREEERHDVDMREATVAKQEEKRREGKHHRSESRDKVVAHFDFELEF